MKSFLCPGLRLAFFLTMVLIPGLIFAQAYKWTDEDGNVGFTDDFSKVPEKYKNSAIPAQPAKERTKEVDQQPYRSGDMMEEMVRKFPGISYKWTQNMSLWIKVPASMASQKHELEELAIKIAYHYHKLKGHMVCVRFYYADGKVIVRECR